MEMKTLRQNIKRQLGYDNPDEYLRVFTHQTGHCAMCLEKHDKYDLVPNTLRLQWELSLICQHCNHTLVALSRPDEGLMKEYIQNSLVR